MWIKPPDPLPSITPRSFVHTVTRIDSKVWLFGELYRYNSHQNVIHFYRKVHRPDGSYITSVSVIIWFESFAFNLIDLALDLRLRLAKLSQDAPSLNVCKETRDHHSKHMCDRRVNFLFSFYELFWRIYSIKFEEVNFELWESRSCFLVCWFPKQFCQSSACRSTAER